MNKQAKLALEALTFREWSADRNDGNTPTCLWCGGWKTDPQMDEDYSGKAGHKPDCLRQRAIAALQDAPARTSQEGRPK